MYDEYSLASEDLEPRMCIPLRTANVANDNVPVPSVPEVSIISDQASQHPRINQQQNRSDSSWPMKMSPAPKSTQQYTPLPPINSPPKNPNGSDPTNYASYDPSDRRLWDDIPSRPQNTTYPQHTRSGHLAFPEYPNDQYETRSQSLPLRHRNQESPQNPYRANDYSKPRSQSYQNVQQNSLERPDTDNFQTSKKSVTFQNQSHSAQSFQQEHSQRSLSSRSQSPNPQDYYSPNPRQTPRQKPVKTYSPICYQEKYDQYEKSNDPGGSYPGHCKVVKKYPPKPDFESPRYCQNQSQDYSGDCCGRSSNSSGGNLESSDTLRNLLMLVHSLNERMKCQQMEIKCLQMQMNRLLNIYEESQKEERRCCSCSEGEQARSYGRDEMGERRMMKMCQENAGMGGRSQEDKANPTFVEQKVSIGVMTSFELTVQNNQQMLDVEHDENMEDFRDKTKRHMYQENFDKEFRKRQTPISRKPNGLENITEDTESHMSSHPRSSHLQNSSNSGRHTPDKMRQIDFDSHQRMFPNDNSTDLPFRTMNSHGPNKKLAAEFDDRTPQNCQYPNRNFAMQKEQERRGNCDKNYYGERGNEQQMKLQQNNQVSKQRAARNRELNDRGEELDYSSDDSCSPANHTPNVGWTFYNNVLGQVNRILKNSPDNYTAEDGRPKPRTNLKNVDPRKLDSVKAATLEQLAKMGISLIDNEANPNRKKFNNVEASYYPKVPAELNMPHGASTMTETNTSMKMKALALKYLNEEQLTDQQPVLQKQKAAAVKQVVTSNEDDSNFSIATMKYLQKYQLLPGNQGNYEDYYAEETENMPMPKRHEDMRTRQRINEQSPCRRNSGQSSNVCTNKILDMTALKNQPKLR